jgi:hypothetical protein
MSRVEKTTALRTVAMLGAAAGMMLVTFSPAFAGGVGNLSCVGGARSFNCVGQWKAGGDPYVRAVPEGMGESAKAEAAARDRNWLARCRPTIERDIYGVARYLYAAPGCEFGVGAD